MNVAFDVTSAAFEKKTGTGVYCEEFVKAYQRRFESDKVYHTYRLTRFLKGRKFFLPKGHANRRAIFDPLTSLTGFNYDIFHGLNTRLPKLMHCKKVVTIFDLFSIFGGFSSPEFKKDQTEKLLATFKRADHIVVAASFAKKQLVDKMGIDPRKISLVPLGVRDVYLKARRKDEAKFKVGEKYRILKPYLLYVGTLELRKNVVGLIKSYIELQRLRDDPPDLILVGNEGFKFSEIAQAIEDSGLKHKIKVLGFVSDDDLADLYTACEAFVFLSLEEGFGIPVIEAMACGVPVITSDTTSLPEVGNGFTWMVGPHEYLKAAKMLELILKGEAETKKRVDAGKVYAHTQTWTRVVEETRKVYQSLSS